MSPILNIINNVKNLLGFITKKEKNLPQYTTTTKNRTLLQGKINAILVNDCHISSPCLEGAPRSITTPKERWAYAIEFFFKDTLSAERAIKLTFKINHGEVGILLVGLDGKTMEERIVSKSASAITHLIDCTQKNFSRLYIRNTSPYGHTQIDFISATLSPLSVTNPSAEFPGFKDFEISREDLLFWPDFFGTRTSTELQLMRAKWLEKQNSPVTIFWQNGIQLCLNPKSNTAKALIVSGYYEPFELSTFQFIASKATTTVDIGANIGIYALTAAVANPSSQVYAIEPSARESQTLKKNLELNHASNLEILNTALGEQDGPILLGLAPEEISGHNQVISLGPTINLQAGWTHCQVNCSKLDSLRLHMKLPIDLIKIDVEGQELAVLNGARSTLNQDTPHILLELTGGLWTNTPHAIQVIGLLQELGYKIFDLDRKLGIWRKFSGWRSETNGNILCIHEDKIESLADINLHLTKEFNKAATPKYHLQSIDLKILDPLHIFCHSSALAINEARIAHLDTLNLNLQGKKVLEVGGGIGLLSPYFLSLGCDITFTDSRQENLDIAKQRLKNLVQAKLLNLDACTTLEQFDQTEVVYCYGTLYHLAKPAEAIAALASTKANMILLETCVNRAKDSLEIDFENENANNPNQASSGIGARPTRHWVANEMKKYWKYVYYTTTQPAYPDFPENWNAPTIGNTRAIFIGSNTECYDKFLTQILPSKQHEAEINYHMMAFKRLDDLYPWLKSLAVNSRFMVTVNDKLPIKIEPILNHLLTMAIITTISPCLDNTTLICGRIRGGAN